MAIWTIELTNNSGEAKDYAIFSAPPEVTFNDVLVTVHTCAWLTYQGVGPGEKRRSTFSESVFAGADLNNVRLEPGVVILNSTAMPIDARARDGTSLLNGEGGEIFSAARHDQAAYGSVSITTPDPLAGPFAPFKVAALVLGKIVDSHVANAMAAFPPQPGGVFQIKPSSRFHLIQGQYVHGEVLAPDTASEATIDFTGHDDVKATVIHRPDGRLTVSFGPNPIVEASAESPAPSRQEADAGSSA
jgi:hypothetical protein